MRCVPARRAALRNGLRHALMAVQVALAVLLLVVAGLFYRGFADSKTSDPGFRTEGVLLAAYDLTGQMMPGSTDDATRARTFVQTLLARLRENPAVDGAAVAASVPLDIHGLPSRSFVVEGRARSDGRRDESLSNIVTPGYFAALGIPLIEGRDFASLDEVAAPRQVIVNESFRQKYLADTPAHAATLKQLRGLVDGFVKDYDRGFAYEDPVEIYRGYNGSLPEDDGPTKGVKL